MIVMNREIDSKGRKTIKEWLPFSNKVKPSLYRALKNAQNDYGLALAHWA